MKLPGLEEVRRRAVQMEAARRTGTQEGLPEPSAAVRAIEDRLVAGEITMKAALAAFREGEGRFLPQIGPATEPSSAVPRAPGARPSEAGIIDPDRVARVERAFSDVRIFELRVQPVGGCFDFDHYKAIHAGLLGDVYDRAGQNRGVPALRGDATLARPNFVGSEGQRIFSRLEKDKLLRGLDASAFADKAAKLAADLHALQPAIDGNGRTTRLFLEQVGAQAGHPLDFSRFTRDDLYRHFEASLHEGGKALRPMVLRAMDAGQAMARQLISAASERGFLELAPQAGLPLSVAASAFLRDPEREAVAKHPVLAEAFAAERRMRSAALELGPLAPSVKQAVMVRIREHLAVLVHCEVDVRPSDGILNAVRHDAATAQLDHAVQRVREGRGFHPQSSVGYQAGHGISLEQRDWLVRSADGALREQPPGSPAAAVSSAWCAEARWIASAVGAIDFPARDAAFHAPVLQDLYEEQQRERTAGLDVHAHALQAPALDRHRDPAP